MNYTFEKRIIPDKKGFDYVCWGKIEHGPLVYGAKHLEKEETELDKQEMIAACDYKVKEYLNNSSK